MGFFEKLKAGLTKTKSSLIDSINSLIQGSSRIDDDFFDELEETLIMSDIGGKTSEKIVSELKNRVKEEKIKDTGDVKAALKEIIAGMLGEDSRLDLSTKPSVILVIGVNGAGKTTTIGKLSYQLSKQGKKVLVAAADTFRAAAIEQLAVWCERAGVQLVRHKEGSDPAAVV